MPDFIQTVTIGISAVALIVSVGNFVLQHLYYSDEVVCFVTRTTANRQEGHVIVVAHIVISNPGTRTMMLESGTFEVREKTSEDSHRMLRGIADQKPPLPLVVAKGEARQLEYHLMIHESSLKAFPLNRAKDGQYTVDYFLRFQFLTVAGDKLEFDRKVGSYKSEDNGFTFTHWGTEPVRLTRRRLKTDWEVI